MQIFFHVESRSNDEIVTVTAKIWYVSDFHGKYTQATYEKVDANCEDKSIPGVTNLEEITEEQHQKRLEERMYWK